jgi:uncharacterized membrane protein
MTHPSSNTLRTAALIAALALLWGSGFFWIKLALDGLTPTQLTFGRLALGALVLVPLVMIRRPALPRDAQTWGHLAVSALIANAISYTLFAVAERTTRSCVAGVITAALGQAAQGRAAAREVEPAAEMIVRRRVLHDAETDQVQELANRRKAHAAISRWCHVLPHHMGPPIPE